MIQYDVKQGSEEWHRLRIGIPTASEFDHIITGKKWEPTSGQARRRYALRLLAELVYNIPRDQYVSQSMLHGKDWEPKARAAYEMQMGQDTETVGFCTNDNGTAGASPDCFVGADGSVEIKCPEYPEIHLGYVLTPATLKDEYWVQVQGQLYITGKRWTDLVSYFQGMPMVRERIEPHAEFQEKLHQALTLFVNDLALYVDLAKQRGVEFPEPDPDDPDAITTYREWITEEDGEAILAANRKRDQSLTQ